MNQVKEFTLRVNLRVNYPGDFSLSFTVHQDQSFSREVLTILRRDVDL